MPTTLTRDPDYSPEAAALLAMFNVCAAEHNSADVLQASIDMLVMSVTALARSRKLNEEQLRSVIGQIASHVMQSAQSDLAGIVPENAIPVSIGGN